ncbi:sigma-70 family RNA polymerase sigma factor [Nocardia xishanensis]|uniref:sigma-70 family RNA polymerase sigma factor n=1 Tax=Nocardia xishanensis TaxID=238964 RepID=UPI0033F90832
MPELWLSDPEFDEATERLQRLAGDEQILLTLQLGGFADRDWDPVAQELARYGVAVLTSWIKHRVIYARVKYRTTYGLPMLDGWPDMETALDLATDTVVDALNYFRDNVLKAGKWDPTRGASLRTYFIGQCLFRFVNPYRKAYENEIRRRRTEVLVDDDALFAGAHRDVEDTVLIQDELNTARAQVNSVIALGAMERQAAGFSTKEIAKLFGRTEKQIENMLDYQRRKIRKAAS